MYKYTKLFVGIDPKPAYVVSGEHRADEFIGISAAVVACAPSLTAMTLAMADLSKKYYGPLKWA
jgi:hypothetical protein